MGEGVLKQSREAENALADALVSTLGRPALFSVLVWVELALFSLSVLFPHWDLVKRLPLLLCFLLVQDSDGLPDLDERVSYGVATSFGFYVSSSLQVQLVYPYWPPDVALL